MSKAESVGMSTDGLRRIHEVIQKHMDARNIQGAVTAVARRDDTSSDHRVKYFVYALRQNPWGEMT